MKTPLKGYGQAYRSGMTMKQKWAYDKNIRQETKEAKQKPLPMGRNE